MRFRVISSFLGEARFRNARGGFGTLAGRRLCLRPAKPRQRVDTHEATAARCDGLDLPGPEHFEEFCLSDGEYLLRLRWSYRVPFAPWKRWFLGFSHIIEPQTFKSSEVITSQVKTNRKSVVDDGGPGNPPDRTASHALEFAYGKAGPVEARPYPGSV